MNNVRLQLLQVEHGEERGARVKESMFTLGAKVHGVKPNSTAWNLSGDNSHLFSEITSTQHGLFK